jgi:transcriptional regulator with XRE-family HTH domain
MGLRRGVSSGHQANDDRIDEELSRLITAVTNEINWRMREDDLTRADLAGRMGVSPGRVSQVLSGGENLTLRTLACLATALDGRFEVEFRPHKPADDAYAGQGVDAEDTSV